MDMQAIREPINSITHFIGMMTYIIAFPFVLTKSSGLLQMIAMTVFLMG